MLSLLSGNEHGLNSAGESGFGVGAHPSREGRAIKNHVKVGFQKSQLLDARFAFGGIISG
jgi:hypothetical protein